MERIVSDEPEEGEIVDDFEEISDSSILSTPQSGKSVSNRDLEKDHSLSNISDNNLDDPFESISLNSPENFNYDRRKRRKRPHRRQVKRNRRSLSQSSSEFDEEFDHVMQKQLKTAIRVDTSQQVQRNSLRTRLKVMLGEDEQDEETELQTLRTLALLSTAKNDEGETKGENKEVTKSNEINEETDDELIELRLIALKSAMIQKALERRKRKGGPNLETNKENDVNKENKDDCNGDNVENCDKCNNVINTNEKIEVSSKEPVVTSTNITIEEDVDIMRAKLLASMSNKITMTVSSELSSIPETPKEGPPQHKSLPKSAMYVKPEVKVKPLIINLKDTDSESDERKPQDATFDPIAEFLKKQRAAVEAKHVQKESKKAKLFNESGVRFLSKAQQKEYHMLKQKLLLKERKVAKKSEITQDKMTPLVAPDNVPGGNPTTKPSNVESSQKVENNATIFQHTLEDMQEHIGGRLQMKGKYMALTPLLQKVTEANIERYRCEFAAKKLLIEFKNAKAKFAASRGKYAILVGRLTRAKTAIDKGAKETLIKRKQLPPNVIQKNCTSTPLKSEHQETICDISAINGTSIGSSPVREKVKKIEDKVEENTKTNCDEAQIKKYVSPLDNQNREIDPMTSFCPFELFGLCKDSECKFNHFAKS